MAGAALQGQLAEVGDPVAAGFPVADQVVLEEVVQVGGLDALAGEQLLPGGVRVPGYDLQQAQAPVNPGGGT